MTKVHYKSSTDKPGKRYFLNVDLGRFEHPQRMSAAYNVLFEKHMRVGALMIREHAAGLSALQLANHQDLTLGIVMKVTSDNATPMILTFEVAAFKDAERFFDVIEEIGKPTVSAYRVNTANATSILKLYLSDLHELKNHQKARQSA